LQLLQIKQTQNHMASMDTKHNSNLTKEQKAY